MSSRRMERLNDLIRDELSDLILREVRDPRLNAMISITRVETTPDLYTSRIHVSIMDTPENQQIALRALNSAAAFFHRELKSRIQTRRIPFLNFALDNSIAEGAEVLALLDRVSHPEPESESESETEAGEEQ